MCTHFERIQFRVQRHSHSPFIIQKSEYLNTTQIIFYATAQSQTQTEEAEIASQGPGIKRRRWPSWSGKKLGTAPGLFFTDDTETSLSFVSALFPAEVPPEVPHVHSSVQFSSTTVVYVCGLKRLFRMILLFNTT